MGSRLRKLLTDPDWRVVLWICLPLVSLAWPCLLSAFADNSSDVDNAIGLLYAILGIWALAVTNYLVLFHRRNPPLFSTARIDPSGDPPSVFGSGPAHYPQRTLQNGPDWWAVLWLGLPLVPVPWLCLIVGVARDPSDVDGVLWLLKIIVGFWSVIFATYLVRRFLLQPTT